MLKLKDKTINSALRLALFFILIQVLSTIFSYRKLPPQVPLFYSRPWGPRQLAPPLLYFLLPLFSLLVLVINFLFANFLAKEEKLAQQLLVIFATIFSFLCLVTLLKNIFLIT